MPELSLGYYAVLLGTVSGSKPERRLRKLGVQNPVFKANDRNLKCTIVRTQELPKLRNEYECCFIDCPFEPTQEQLDLIAIDDKFVLQENHGMVQLAPFLDSCGSHLAYFDYEGEVDILVHSRKAAVTLVRKNLESLLRDAAGYIVTISDLQMERILQEVAEFMTIHNQDTIVTGNKIELTCWKEINKETAKACEVTLHGDDISMSAWETRPTPEHIKIKTHPVTCLLALTILLAIVAGVLYGLYFLARFVWSQF